MTTNLAARRSDLLSQLSDLQDPHGDLGVIVDQALAENPRVTALTIRAIVADAREDARREAVRS